MGTRGPSSERGKNSYYIGRAGEYAVAAQLMMRHCLVMWPAIDEGYDLFTKTGCRIQVRSSHILPPGKDSEGSYWFGFPKVKHQSINRNSGDVKKIERRPISETCDVVVCWGIEQNRFWVVPSSVFNGAQALVLGIDNPRRFAGKIKPMRDMKALGYSITDIAKQYGIGRVTASRLISGDAEEQRETTFSKARSCENAWEHILNHGKSEPEVDPATVLEEVQHGEQF